MPKQKPKEKMIEFESPEGHYVAFRLGIIIQKILPIITKDREEYSNKMLYKKMSFPKFLKQKYVKKD